MGILAWRGLALALAFWQQKKRRIGGALIVLALAALV